MNAIEARHVRKVFGSGTSGFAALDDVSVTIRENEFFTLLGPSGCGKTTLLRLIAGFDFPTSGEIHLYGEDIASKPPYDRPVNTVFQSYALFPHMTVAENIGFGLEMLGKSKADITSRVDQMLNLVQMEQLRDRKTSQISGGQQQRVALARALAPAPKVLLLDEPLSALDAKLRKDMQIELKRLQAETGITFIFVTHDQEEALTMSDRIAVMNKGKILQIGSPREIYDKPSERFVANFIGDTNFLEGRVAKTAKSTATLKLDAGGEITVEVKTSPQLDECLTVVVRPEHAEIVKPGAKATLSGELENVVYFGTDTHFHLKLMNGSRFTVRRQNARSSTVDFQVGQAVGVSFEPGAAQVLKD
jgi:spermidine/putrescine transport system ATP-binding protein